MIRAAPSDRRFARYVGSVISGIDHVVICVSDVEKSTEWYRAVLGLQPERLEEWRAGTAPFVSLRVDDTTLIDLFHGPPDGRNVDHVAYVTNGVDFDRFVSEHGDIVEMGPADLFGARGQGRGVYIRDPDDNRVEIRTYE